MEQTNFSPELYTKCVRAGKRRYYIDVKSTRSGKDCYITITESRSVEGDKFEKTKIFLFREDFEKFLYFLDETIHWANKNFVAQGSTVSQQVKPAETTVEHAP